MAIANALEVTLDCTRTLRAVTLVGLGEPVASIIFENPYRVFGLVLVGQTPMARC